MKLKKGIKKAKKTIQNPEAIRLSEELLNRKASIRHFF